MTFKNALIDSVCGEIKDLEIDRPWATHLDTIDPEWKYWSRWWVLTRADTEPWFRHVLERMPLDEILEWARANMFVVPYDI